MLAIVLYSSYDIRAGLLVGGAEGGGASVSSPVGAKQLVSMMWCALIVTDQVEEEVLQS